MTSSKEDAPSPRDGGKKPLLAPGKKLVGDTLLITLVGLINRLKGLVFIPIIVRAVGFEGYGAFIQVFIIDHAFAQ